MTDIPDAHAGTDPDESPPTPWHDFREHRTWFYCPGPQVLVRFPDGFTVEFRPGSDWPRLARVAGAGIAINGLALDIEASIEPDGSWTRLSLWKTGVSGVDGGADVGDTYRDAALARCRARAREARQALGASHRGQR